MLLDLNLIIIALFIRNYKNLFPTNIINNCVQNGRVYLVKCANLRQKKSDPREVHAEAVLNAAPYLSERENQ